MRAAFVECPKRMRVSRQLAAKPSSFRVADTRLLTRASEERARSSAQIHSLHSCHPRPRKNLHPAIKIRACRRNRPVLLSSATHVFHAVADRLLVNVEPNVIHMFVEEPPWLFSESTSPLSSAFCTPCAPRSTYIQTTQKRRGTSASSDR